jgi:hypothetical protein
MTPEDEEFNRIEREAGMRKETVKEHMTKDEALKLALECIEAWDRGCSHNDYWRDIEAAITAIKQALAAPVQERNFCERCGKRLGSGIHTCTPPAAPVQETLITDEKGRPMTFWGGKATPPAAQWQWVGLTKTVVGNHLRRHALGDQSTFHQGFKEGVAFAELKLKEKQ